MRKNSKVKFKNIKKAESKKVKVVFLKPSTKVNKKEELPLSTTRGLS